MSLCLLQRIGINHTWNSQWITSFKPLYKKFLIQDIKIRNFIEKWLKNCNLGKIKLIRSHKNLNINVECLYISHYNNIPEQVLNLKKKQIEKIAVGQKVFLNIIELNHNVKSAKIFSQNIVKAIKNTTSVKKVLLKFVKDIINLGVKGVIIVVSGRLTGERKTQYEKFSQGSINRNNLNQKLDYHCTHYVNKYGSCGVKIWIALND